MSRESSPSAELVDERVAGLQAMDGKANEIHIDMTRVDMRDVYSKAYKRPHPSAFATVRDSESHLPRDTCITLGPEAVSAPKSRTSSLMFSPQGSVGTPVEDQGHSFDFSDDPDEVLRDEASRLQFFSINETKPSSTPQGSPILSPSRASVTSTGSIGDVLVYAQSCPQSDRWRAEYLPIIAPILQRVARGYLARRRVFASFEEEVQNCDMAALETASESAKKRHLYFSRLCEETKEALRGSSSGGGGGASEAADRPPPRAESLVFDPRVIVSKLKSD